MRGLAACSLLLALIAAPSTAAACAADPPRDDEVSPPLTLLLGENYRWPHLILPLRFAADLVAIPAGIARWDRQDFELAAVLAGTVGALMTPDRAGSSADARLQRWVRAPQPPGQYLLWTPLGDAAVWGGLWAIAGGALAYGWVDGDPALMESVSLMIEAFSLAQVSQVGIKLLLGREGPRDGEALGVIHGPAGFFRLFPAGTPSGHAAALYAMIGAASTYWQSPWLDVPIHLFGVFFAATLVTDDYHFISDVVWGAAMGYSLGRWVVRNRSTRYRFDGSVLVPSVAAPVIAPASGRYGLSLGWTF